MLKLGITSHEENEAAALALAEAVSMNAAAWNYIYVHMLAAALRYMLPMMHRIPRSAKPGEIVGSGWRLVATIRTAKEHTDFRKLLQEKLSTDNQDILTDDQWRATARLAAILVIFVTLVSRIDDESFTRIQREDFLRTIFRDLIDMPWYLPPRLEDIEPRFAKSITVIFSEIAYKPNKKIGSKRQTSGRLNCTTVRKNMKTVYKLLKLYDFKNVRYTPGNLFARIWAVSKMRGGDEIFLPTLMMQFQQESNMDSQQATNAVQPTVQQPTDGKQKKPSEAGTTAPKERGKSNKYVVRATVDWPLEFTDSSCKVLRSPRDGHPPHLPGLTVLNASAARWRARSLNAVLRTAAVDLPVDTVAGPPQVNQATMDARVPPLPGILHYDSAFQDGYDMNDMGQDFALTDPIPDNIFDEGLKFSFDLM